ncbi:unnamed protein product [Mycena citricolor]|uniref:Uncharacterized protein n=1 Tax=Mycena citricolor TaxID=2018698 RepID=A0AAD2HPH5_9AGAR|nr:unnamed protein product [Mycena citricolor]
MAGLCIARTPWRQAVRFRPLSMLLRPRSVRLWSSHWLRREAHSSLMAGTLGTLSKSPKTQCMDAAFGMSTQRVSVLQRARSAEVLYRKGKFQDLSCLTVALD